MSLRVSETAAGNRRITIPEGRVILSHKFRLHRMFDLTFDDFRDSRLGKARKRGDRAVCR
jgi:hypothetical protein